jgi:2-polyprenyl-3-methyl-5-hydroxy-6-metoxy-1,4-benzoquinol methylase
LDIPYPPGQNVIKIQQCSICDLRFKEFVPLETDLAQVLGEEGTDVWSAPNTTFVNERDLVESHFPAGNDLDILDIGSGDGAMLRSLNRWGGRRSGLDIVTNPVCRDEIHGEYLLGLLEDDIAWSGRPYDVVLAFDILEHLFRPAAAWENIARYVKPHGLLIIETGDANFPAANGARGYAEWWYANLFEHHVFWNQAALERAAHASGFELISHVRRPHKGRAYLSAARRIAIGALRACARVRGAADMLRRPLGRDIRLLGDPSARDHILAVFRRS